MGLHYIVIIIIHVVAGCSTYLIDGRFTWCHSSMLQFIANSFKSVPDSVLYVDLPGFITPSVLSGYSLRSDLLLTISKKCLYILELTVGFETNMLTNAVRKAKMYADLIRLQQRQFDSVKFISLSISTLGVFSLPSNDFLIMLKEIGFDEKHINYITRTLTGIAIRSTYYVFCKRGKEWESPELLFIKLSYIIAAWKYCCCCCCCFFFFFFFFIISYIITIVLTNCKLPRHSEVYDCM